MKETWTLFLRASKPGGPTYQWVILTDLDKEEVEIFRQSRITRAATERLWRKQIDGAKEHGYVMQPGDRRVLAIPEALAEVVDLLQYLEKATIEGGD